MEDVVCLLQFQHYITVPLKGSRNHLPSWTTAAAECSLSSSVPVPVSGTRLALVALVCPQSKHTSACKETHAALLHLGFLGLVLCGLLVCFLGLLFSLFGLLVEKLTAIGFPSSSVLS